MITYWAGQWMIASSAVTRNDARQPVDAADRSNGTGTNGAGPTGPR
ncbi:MAG: hypothetical protein OHK0013_38770 [Sandaracinaceae bacterium]